MKQRLVDLWHRRLVDGQHRARRALQPSPEEMAELTSPQMGPGALVQNAYSTMSTKAMYDGFVRDQPNTRQFILSRSGFCRRMPRGGRVVRRRAAPGTTSSSRSGRRADRLLGPTGPIDIGGYTQEGRFQDDSGPGPAGEPRGGGRPPRT